jgi:hypothetical protein
MNDLAERWAQGGCRVMVMKGQANAVFYPHPDHRDVGDIDCYLFGHYVLGNAIAREAEAKVDERWYKHSVISYKGETFENHRFFVHTREGKRSKRLEEELEDALRLHSHQFTNHDSVLFPPVQWTAMFLTYHACAHFISEGLRLKQLLDWAMFLHKHQNEVDWSRFMDFCERFHLRRFADAATAICAEYLGVRITNLSIVKVSPYAERMLHSTLYDDDYVFATTTGWRSRLHLLKNLWTYRWKYQDIYQMNPLRQLWYYFSGYLFKTE